MPREWHLRLDPLLLLATLGLVACSLVALNGATQNDIPGEPHYYVTRQAIYAGVGLVLMYGVSRIDYSRLRELRYPIYGVLLALIVLGAGDRPGHARLQGVDRAAGLQLPAVRARQGAAGRGAVGLRGRPHAPHGPRHHGPDHAARAGPDDARDRRAGPRLGARLRRRHARGAVRRRRAVAALRRARRAVRGRRHAGARGGADGRRRGAQALPGRSPDVVPAPVGRSRRGGLPAAAGADRHRLGREDRPRRRERDPDVARTSCPSTTPTSSSP